ncbi:hypothetical protein Mapa_017027 [Marchantia paleacea]|nr:hypothetical protein Mapa_017027 [Marchantia paleacea]
MEWPSPPTESWGSRSLPISCPRPIPSTTAGFPTGFRKRMVPRPRDRHRLRTRELRSRPDRRRFQEQLPSPIGRE